MSTNEPPGGVTGRGGRRSALDRYVAAEALGPTRHERDTAKPREQEESTPHEQHHPHRYGEHGPYDRHARGGGWQHRRGHGPRSVQGR